MTEKNIGPQLDIVQRFVTLEKKGRLAHAYLFVGPAYAGKGETAAAVAQRLHCEAPPEGPAACGQCPSCLKVVAGHHPDLHVIDNGYVESIKIDEVRELLARIKLRPFMGGKKVFIIRNVENMTTEGANALLKTLEEPSSNSLLLLTTSVVEKNLDTVRSRCHVMYFALASETSLADHLRAYYDVEASRAHFFAYFAEGCLGAARRMQERNLFEWKNDVIDGFILRRADDPFAREILADQETTRLFLDVLLTWVRDALLLKTGVDDDRLVHRDRSADLRTFQRRFSFKDLGEIHEEVIEMCRLRAENLNLKIPLSIIRERLVYG